MKRYILTILSVSLILFASCTPEEETRKWTVTVQSANNTMGYTLGAGVYDNNTTAHIVAVPNSNYRFVMWNDGNTANPREVIVTKDTSFIAYFDVDSSNVSMWVITVNPEFRSFQLPDGTTINVQLGDVEGGGTYPFGSSVQIKAIGKDLNVDNRYFFISRFKQWSDGDTHIIRQIAVTGNCEYTAKFEIEPSVFENVDDNTVIGKWNITSHSSGEYWKFYADHTGIVWDESEDINEDETNLRFTWQIADNHRIEVIFRGENGNQTVTKKYNVLLLREDGFITFNGYGLEYWHRVSEK